MKSKRAKSALNVEALDNAIDALHGLINEFDVNDPEDAKVRMDLVVDYLIEANAVGTFPKGVEADLGMVVAGLRGPLSRRFLLHVNGFVSKLKIYQLEPSSNEMYDAAGLLEDFGPPLLKDLEALKGQ